MMIDRGTETRNGFRGLLTSRRRRDQTISPDPGRPRQQLRRYRFDSNFTFFEFNVHYFKNYTIY
ncbi:MAG: hypothetical protein EHM72_19695 [Calditrichaeota bacterium]|nr:MAG: hypothetical protein EHM72_19695 [Calditrichota bacterium]